VASDAVSGTQGQNIDQIVTAEPSRSDWSDAERATNVLDDRLQVNVLLGNGLILGPSLGLGLV
jgi:hypothetical protein